MVWRPAVLGNERHLDTVGSRPCCELRRVPVPDRAAMLPHPLPIFKLSKQHGGEQVGRQIARTDVHPRVFVDETTEELAPVRPLLTDDLRALDVARIVDDDRSSLSAR